jgi:hypothetical protein
VLMFAFGSPVAQSGINAIQRNSSIRSDMIPAGAIVGAWIGCDSATATLRRLQGQAVVPRRKAGFSFSIDYPNGNSTAWMNLGVYEYVKVYFKGYN